MKVKLRRFITSPFLWSLMALNFCMAAVKFHLPWLIYRFLGLALVVTLLNVFAVSVEEGGGVVRPVGSESSGAGE